MLLNAGGKYHAAMIGAGLLAKFCFWKHYALWFIPFFMFYVLLRGIEDKTPRQSFWGGYLFGVGYFVGSLHWVYLSFDCVNLFGAGVVANTLLVLYLAMYSALSCYVYQKFCPRNYALFACIWSIFEYLRGITFTGFPWNLIGYAVYDLPYFKQTASLFGIYGVSLVFMLIVCLSLSKKTLKHSAFIAFIVMGYGWYIEEINQPILTNGVDVRLTIVQPCISQRDKMNRSMFMNNLNIHISLSGLDQVYRGRRLIIWPEAASSVFEAGDYVSSCIIYPDTYVFTGADRLDTEGHVYNSSCVIGKGKGILAVYDKKHLLPFGEFIPNLLLVFGLKKIASGMTDFSSGTRNRLISIKNIPEFAPIICYESAFPGEIIEKGGKPKWIVNITNDAWFSGSDEIYQHLRTTVFRAIEEGLPIIRSANTGISCVIDCKGKITKMIPENTEGVINTAVPDETTDTLFSKVGNLLFFAMVILICLIQTTRKRLFARTEP
jgi:apolipoprotein N-acyltransferase